MKDVISGLGVLAVLVIAYCAYMFFSGGAVQTSTIRVTEFYDGKDGYSISVPTGNSSTCIWNYAGGNAAIPYSETTEARTATEKHTIYTYDYYDWKVTCVDDFGNHYTGSFPTE